MKLTFQTEIGLLPADFSSNKGIFYIPLFAKFLSLDLNKGNLPVFRPSTVYEKPAKTRYSDNLLYRQL